MSDSCENLSESVPQPLAPTDTGRRAKIFAALGDPTRLRIIEMLTQQTEMSGSEVASQAGISLALFCHHSKILAEAGLIRIRKDGQTKYNSINWQVLKECFQGLIKSE
ncbi:ArsR family transcriptional regulatory protein (Modular protein) [Planktothrix serta PCC 8927]|uniref:ArsR family transcriptional regulatory protein (Modular protein) n=1 Tax=Planktothrix serta PCC 8927 TaxID=671068 RepID=A0A7Z9E159_9CYAN|nr:metalloregulator ArsR/SmtB family transcription factor [Planktothrix serta]VXD22208.1 ArsR family transcriptional regulatory protein (Modular protein) [Planktothrix serta PCC 8927]